MKLSEVPLRDIRPGFTVVKAAHSRHLGIVARISEEKNRDDYMISIAWGAIENKDGLPKLSILWHFWCEHIEVISL